MLGRSEARWRIHPISLCLSVCQFVFPFPSFPASHLLQRTLLGTAGWESMHCWDRLRESSMNARRLPVFSLIKVWFSSRLLYHRQTRASIKGGGGQKKEENDLFVFSVEDLLCSGVNCISGDEISEQSLQWSSPALSAWVPPGSPPNGCITRKQSCVLNMLDCTCWLALRISLFDGFATRESTRLFCISTARNQRVVFPRNTPTKRTGCDSLNFVDLLPMH